MLSPNSSSINELERALPALEVGGSTSGSGSGWRSWDKCWTEEMKRTQRIIEATFDPGKEENRKVLAEVEAKARGGEGRKGY